MKKYLLATIVICLGAPAFADSYAGRHYILNRFLAISYQQNKKLGLVDTSNIQNQTQVELFFDPAVSRKCKIKITSSKPFIKRGNLVQGHTVEVDRNSVNQIEISDGYGHVSVAGIEAGINYAYSYEPVLNKTDGNYFESESLVVGSQRLEVNSWGGLDSIAGFAKFKPQAMAFISGSDKVVCQTTRSIYLK